MRKIVVAHVLLESLKSIGEMSFDDVEISPATNDSSHMAKTAAAAGGTDFGALWKTIESSPGRAGIARRVEARAEQKKRCLRVVRIDGETSQFGTLRILPQTQCQIWMSDIPRD